MRDFWSEFTCKMEYIRFFTKRFAKQNFNSGNVHLLLLLVTPSSYFIKLSESK